MVESQTTIFGSWQNSKKCVNMDLAAALALGGQLTECQVKWVHTHSHGVSQTFSFECILYFNYSKVLSNSIQVLELPLLLPSKPVPISIQIVYSIRSRLFFIVSTMCWFPSTMLLHACLLSETVFETYSCKAISSRVSTQPKQTKKKEKKGESNYKYMYMRPSQWRQINYLYSNGSC